jgi:MSHA biogenesis protein MshI
MGTTPGKGSNLFSFLKNQTARTDLAALGLQAGGVCLARVDRQGGSRPRLMACEFQAVQLGEEAKTLAQLASQHALKRARCTTVMAEGDYQLLLTEAPDVGPDELKQALRWKIKDLIDFHINDATLDVFDLPGAAPGAKSREMYTVAARNEAIQRRVDLLTEAGIGLDVIDIPELAQRNLAALLPEDTDGVALLSLQEKSGLVTITRQGYIYLSRALNIGHESLRTAADPARYFDHIVLEIQRSLDYFESHFREAPIRHLVLAPLAEPVPGFVDHLRANLNAAVGSMDLSQLLDSDVELTPALQARCLNTIGAALRQEAKTL